MTEGEVPQEVRRGRAFVVAVVALTWVAMVALSGTVTLLVALGLAALSGEDPAALFEPARLEGLLKQPGLLVFSVVVNSAVMAVAAVVGSLFGPGREGLGSSVAARLGFDRVSPLDVLVVTLGALGLGSALDALVFFSGLRDTGSLGLLHEVLGALEGQQLWLAALIIGAAPGFGEEVFFRGFVLRRLVPLEGAKIAVIASSIAFGLFHLDPVHTPAAAALGLYLGVLVLKTGSVWTSIGAHAVNNAVATALATLSFGGAEHGVLLGAGAVSALFAFRFVARRAAARGSTFAASAG